jgi:hypothetical protein
VNALQVAVLHAGGEGELRVVPLGAGQAAPQGAAIAMLVPVSENDGQMLSRLLQAGRDKGEST